MSRLQALVLSATVIICGMGVIGTIQQAKDKDEYCKQAAEESFFNRSTLHVLKEQGDYANLSMQFHNVEVLDELITEQCRGNKAWRDYLVKAAKQPYGAN